MFDYLVVGAGFSGAVVAAQMARNFGKAGAAGGPAEPRWRQRLRPSRRAWMLVHKYGPHIFHTNSKKVFDYLSLFTIGARYYHQVLASVEGKRFPFRSTG